jgi:hypothetical protein
MVRGSRFAVVLACVAWAAVSAGCRRAADAAPPCGAVGTRFTDLARYDLSQARVDDVTARAFTEQLPAMRDALVQACSDGKWPAAVRTCLVQAGDHAGFETCEHQLTDEQRRDLDRANRGSSAPPR